MKRIVVSVLFIVFLTLPSIAQQQRGQSTRPGSASGKNYALIIGVQNYEDQKISALEFPINDSKNVREALTRNYLFEDNNIIHLLDPDRETIISTLDQLTRQLSSNDNLLIFYAGHGYWDKDRDQGYWFPRDAQYSNRSKWISNGDLRDAIRAIKTRSTLLITDACFSGSIFRAVRSAFRTEAEIDSARKYTARIAITSGSLTTVPDRSIFIKYLVKRLNENSANYLLASDLFKQIETPVKSNGPSSPLYGAIQETGHEGGDFVFARRSTSAAAYTTSVIAQNTLAPTSKPNNTLANKVDTTSSLPSDPISRAETLMRRSDYAAASNAAQSLLKANPNNIVAKRIIFESNFYRTMDMSYISDEFTSIAQKPISENNAREYEALGTANLYKSIDDTDKYFTSHDYKTSIDAFTKAISIDSNLATAYYGRGLAFIQRGDFVSSISDFNQAINLDNNYAPAIVSRGMAYFYQGDYVQALQDMNQALKIQPELAPSYIFRGMSYMKQSNSIAAIADFNQAIRIAPKYGFAYNQRAEYYLSRKQFDLAAQDFITGIKSGYSHRFSVKHRHGYGLGSVAAEDLCDGFILLSKHTIAFQSTPGKYHNHGFIIPITNIKELTLSQDSRVFMKVDIQESKKVKTKKYDFYTTNANVLKTKIDPGKPLTASNTNSQISCDQICVAKNFVIFTLLKITATQK